MQLIVYHKVEGTLDLPLNYNHILQSIIYKNLNTAYFNSSYIHQNGFRSGNRNYKLFTFSPIKGKYEIKGQHIVFKDQVSFEVRSPEPLLIRILEENLKSNGINYIGQCYETVETMLNDKSVESEETFISMISPIVLYSTDLNTKKTHFYSPHEKTFQYYTVENFRRKYNACYGIYPSPDIYIEPISVLHKVSNYQNFYINGWLGEYHISGPRKYLDFLYQTGLGSKNSQGFGMFDFTE